jgi:hypothetical protein
MGQRAIWAAKAFPEIQKAGRRKKNFPDSGNFPMVNTQRLSEARTLRDFAPELAEQVLMGKGEANIPALGAFNDDVPAG